MAARFGKQRAARKAKSVDKARPAPPLAQTPLAETPLPETVASPSPSPMTNLILADVLLRAGGSLLRRTVETGVLGQTFGKNKAKKIVKSRSMTQTLIGTAIARIATRSVPGAILVGGGLLAKTLYDRRRKAKARIEGAAAVEKQADKA